jgi:spermidine/putrescine transport system substrate-binding protein
MALVALNAVPVARRLMRRAALGVSLAVAAGLVATAPAVALETLVLYNWATYFPPDLLKKFEADTGIRVITEVYESNEAMLANVETGVGNYDVIVPSDYMVRIMIDRGLLQPVDASGMENFRYVKPPFDDPWYDPGRRYSVPNMQGTSGFIYDARQVEGGRVEESWGEFFDPRHGADRQGRRA